MSISIIKNTNFGTHNTTAGRQTPKYIVVHYTATAGASGANEITYFNRATSTAGSADYFVDEFGIYQYNMQIDSRYSWAVGVDYSGGRAAYQSKCTNRNSISIEMCCKTKNGRKDLVACDSNWYIEDKTVANTIELVKYLMQTYNIPASNVIRHYDVCWKECPGVREWLPRYGESAWVNFKNAILGNNATKSSTNNATKTLYRVRKSANDAKTQIGAFYNLVSAKAQADNNSGYSVFDTSGNLVYAPSGTAKKSVTEIAKEVIAGKWGNGDTRKTALEKAGYDYSAVQVEVNKLLG